VLCVVLPCRVLCCVVLCLVWCCVVLCCDCIVFYIALSCLSCAVVRFEVHSHTFNFPSARSVFFFFSQTRIWQHFGNLNLLLLEAFCARLRLFLREDGDGRIIATREKEYGRYYGENARYPCHCKILVVCHETNGKDGMDGVSFFLS
jgi:hypothetical protein